MLTAAQVKGHSHCRFGRVSEENEESENDVRQINILEKSVPQTDRILLRAAIVNQGTAGPSVFPPGLSDMHGRMLHRCVDIIMPPRVQARPDITAHRAR